MRTAFTLPLAGIACAIALLCCTRLVAQEPRTGGTAQPQTKVASPANADIGRPPATGVLVHEDWSRWDAVADLYPQGQHDHTGLGPSPMQFRMEGTDKHLPAGWDPARVFKTMLHLGADPSGVFPRVLGIRLQPGVSFTWGGWPPVRVWRDVWDNMAEVNSEFTIAQTLTPAAVTYASLYALEKRAGRIPPGSKPNPLDH